MKTTAAIVVALVALAFFLESWARGYMPGDPDGIAGRMRNVTQLTAIGGALALASLLPLGVVRWVLLALAVAAVLAAVGYRLEIL